MLDSEGIAAAGALLAAALSRPDGAYTADLVTELAHLLFRIAEHNGWGHDAQAFNTLVTTWPEIQMAARAAAASGGTQSTFEFG
ncbi:MAG: hypothetical protein FWG25_10205 [Promicromonosporaceae bacterium]|nr:hypothetical protein [Promicromonosporaceae bacterium]